MSLRWQSWEMLTQRTGTNQMKAFRLSLQYARSARRGIKHNDALCELLGGNMQQPGAAVRQGSDLLPGRASLLDTSFSAIRFCRIDTTELTFMDRAFPKTRETTPEPLPGTSKKTQHPGHGNKSASHES